MAAAPGPAVVLLARALFSLAMSVAPERVYDGFSDDIAFSFTTTGKRGNPQSCYVASNVYPDCQLSTGNRGA